MRWGVAEWSQFKNHAKIQYFMAKQICNSMYFEYVENLFVQLFLISQMRKINMHLYTSGSNVLHSKLTTSVQSVANILFYFSVHKNKI